MLTPETSGDTVTKLGIVPQLAVRAATFGTLAGKVIEELKDWHQFTDPKRREDLWTKGRRSLGATIDEIVINLAQATSSIEPTLAWGENQDGLIACTSRQTYIAAVVIPLDWRTHYYHPGRTDSSSDVPSARYKLVSTTLNGKAETGFKNKEQRYPSEGYKDSAGVRVPFMHRKRSSAVQHGGVFIDNSSGQISVLDYSKLTAARNNNLSKHQVIMEANWYLDSDDVQEVLQRPNLRQPRPYSCLGTMFLKDNSQRLFGISCYDTAYNSIEREFGLTQDVDKHHRCPREVTLAQIAATAEIISNRFKAVSWCLAGMEFNGGGMWINSLHTYRDFFAFLPPQHLA